MFSNLMMLVLSAAALVAFASIKRIPEGTVYTLRRFNGQGRTLQPGTHLVWPLLERVVHRISLAGHALNLDESMPLANTLCRLNGKVYWQVIDAERADALIDNADELIRSRTLNAVRGVENPADEALEARNARLKSTLNEALRERGIVVTRVQLTLL
ncbi:MAG: SPFH domain-containing protein [Tahibacter sp.]